MTRGQNCARGREVAIYTSKFRHTGSGLYNTYISLLEKFWRILLYVYVTDDAIAQLYLTKSLVKLRKMVENLVTYRL